MGSSIDRFLRETPAQRPAQPSPTAPFQPPAVDPLEAARKRALEQAQANEFLGQVRASADLSKDLDQQTGSRIVRVQAQTGMPYELVKTHLDEIERDIASRRFSLDSFATQHPRMAEWMAANPARAAAVRDDLPQLSLFGRTVAEALTAKQRGFIREQMLGPGQRRWFGAPQPGDDEILARAESELARMAPDEELPFVLTIPAILAEQVDQQINTMGGAAVTAGLLYGAGAVAQQVGKRAVGAGAVAAATGAGAPAGGVTAALGAGAMVAGAALKGLSGPAYLAQQAYGAAIREGTYAYLDIEKMRDEQGQAVPREVAVGLATMVAVINGSLEFVADAAVAKNIPGVRNLVSRAALKRLLANPTARTAVWNYARNIGGAMLAEGSTEALQGMVTTVATQLSTLMTEGEIERTRGMTDDQMLNEIFGAIDISGKQVAQEFVAGAVVGGAMSAGFGTFSLVSDLRAVQDAEAFRARMQRVVEAGADLKVAKAGSPDVAADVLGQLVNQQQETVWIDPQEWTTFFQSDESVTGGGIDPRAAAARVIGDPAVYDEAVRTQSPMPVPLAKAIAVLGNNRVTRDFLVQHMQAAPGDMSAAEAQRVRTTIVERMQQVEAEATAAREVSAPVDALLTEVETYWRESATQEGRAAEDVAQVALLARGRAETFLAAGIRPERVRELMIQKVGISRGTVGTVPNLGGQPGAAPEAAPAPAAQPVVVARQEREAAIATLKAEADALATEFAALPEGTQDPALEERMLAARERVAAEQRRLEFSEFDGEAFVPTLSDEEAGQFTRLTQIPQESRTPEQQAEVTALQAKLRTAAKAARAKRDLLEVSVAEQAAPADVLMQEGERPKKKPGSDIGHKREATTGRYIGAPDWVTSGAQLTKLRKQLRSLAVEGEVGRFWYEVSARAVLDFVGGDKALAEKFIGLLAIFSPNTGVGPNTTHAIKAWYQWMAGEPISSGQFPTDMGQKATMWLVEGKDWGGVKTNNFYLDLMEEVNPSLIDETHATMDMWMALAFDYGDKKLDQGPKYGFAKREIVRLAKEMGWRPHQVQAAIWTAIRARVMRSAPERKAYERTQGILESFVDPKTGKRNERVVKGREYDHYRTATRFGLERKTTADEIAEDNYDFGMALSERSINLSWEATPGASTGILPGIHTATYAQQVEYLRAIRRALSDAQGRDLIDVRLGLLTGNGLEGASGWQGKPSASVQQVVGVTKEGTALLPTARRLINLAADLRGMLLGQEAVAWHYPIYNESKAAENGTEYKLGRTLSVNEVTQLYAQLERELGHSYAPPVPTASGFRVLNFPDAKFLLASVGADNRLALDESSRNTLREIFEAADALEQAARDKDAAITQRAVEQGKVRKGPGRKPVPFLWDAARFAADEVVLSDAEQRAVTKAMGERNTQFHEAVRRAVAAMPFADEVTDVQRFATDGELRENDWSRGDAQYRERVAAATAELGALGTERFANLQGWIDDDLRPRVEAVNRDFAERYGWDSTEGLSAGDADVLNQGDLATPMLEVDGIARPVQNSEGRPIHPTAEGVRQFWRWFGNSKVVDDLGRPLVVYHGTDAADFLSFAGPTYWSTSPSEASAYGYAMQLAQRQQLRARWIPVQANGALDGVKVPYAGIISDAKGQAKPGDVWATDNGVVRILANGRIEVFTDVVIDQRVPFDVEAYYRDEPSQTLTTGTSDAYDIIAADNEEYIARNLARGDRGRVYAAYLKIENPQALPAFGSDRAGNAFSTRLYAPEIVQRNVDELRAQGFDGVVTESDEAAMFPDVAMDMGEIPAQYVTFEPTQVKSAIANVGAYDPAEGDVYNQQTPPFVGPLWYSALERGIETAKVATQPASQWASWLKGNAPKLGIKAEELEWVDVVGWLTALGNQRVTKDDVLAFVRANGVQVKEYIFGPQPAEMEVVQEYLNALEGEQEYLQNMEEQLDPAERNRLLEIETEIADSRAQLAFIERMGDTYGGRSNEMFEREYTTPGGTEYRELAVVLPVQPAVQTVQPLVAPAHTFGLQAADDNRIFHVRFKTRIDEDGKRVMDVDENQTDYGQVGAKKGFRPRRRVRTPEQTAQLEQLEQQREDLGNAIDRQLDVAVGAIAETFSELRRGDEIDLEGELRASWGDLRGMREMYALRDTMSPEAQRAMRLEAADILVQRFTHYPFDSLSPVVNRLGRDAAVEAISDVIMPYLEYAEMRARYASLVNEIRALGEEPKISQQLFPAPFVMETGSWTSLALKRIIRYAAENGFDRVSWTTGKQQVERYSNALRKKVDRIEWTKTEKGVQLIGTKRNNEVVNTVEKETVLSDAIGKAMAERILNDPAQSGVIEGDGITIDSTGMAGFYDRIMVEQANKLLKRMGGGKVGTVRFGQKLRGLEYTFELVAPPGEQVNADDARRVADLAVGELDAMKKADDSFADADAERVVQYLRWIATRAELLEEMKGGPIDGGSVAAVMRDEFPLLLENKLAGGVLLEHDVTLLQWINSYYADTAEMRVVKVRLERHGFDITPQMRELALQGMPLFQNNAEKEATVGPRGRFFRSRTSGRMHIQLLERANKSTYLHEMAHFFLAVQRELMNEEGASPRLREDYEKLQRWFGDNHAVLRQEAAQYLSTAYEMQPFVDTYGTQRFVVRTPRGDRLTFATEAEARDAVIQRRAATMRDLMSLDEDLIRAMIDNRESDALSDSEALLRVAMEEQFARGFEAYLMEGKAPSPSLRRVFSRFAYWLTKIYRGLSLNVTLTDEVREVMGRMIATEEQIDQAKAAQSDVPLFSHAATEQLIAIGFTEAQATKYVDMLNEAKAAAHDALRVKLMEDITRMDTAWWKRERAEVRKLTTEAAHAMPIYRAWSLLANGTLPDGTEMPGLPPRFKLDKDAAFRLAPVTLVDGAPRSALEDLAGRRVYQTQGLDPDVVAGLMGFANGQALIDALLAAQPLQEYIESQTDAKMKELYPEAIEPANAAALALEALHTKEREAVLRFELQMLASTRLTGALSLLKKLSLTTPPSDMLRAEAARIIGAKTIKALRPDEYLRGQAKAARAAQDAVRKGDWLEAAKQKQVELLNHALYLEAKAARAQIEKDRKAIARIFRSDAKIGNTRDHNLVNAARTVLARVGLGRGDRAPEDWLDNLRRYDSATYDTLLPLLVTGVTERQDPRTLTMDEYRDTLTVALAFWHQSKRTKEAMIRGKAVQIETIASELTDDLAKKKPSSLAQAGHAQARTTMEEMKAGVLGLVASLRRVEAWIEMMDDGNPDGLWRRYIWEPISEAAVAFRLKRDAMAEAYKALLEPLRGTLTGTPIRATEIGYTFKDKAELLGAMLHTGNRGEGSNFDKLIRGRAQLQERKGEPVTWTEDNWNRMIDRLEEEGVLLERDYVFLQGVWDLLESRKADAQKTHYQITGHYFNEVTATPFTTRYGTFGGGYFPAIADGTLSVEAQLRQDKAASDLSVQTDMFPTPPRGFTKNRVEAFAAPLVMHLNLVSQHLDAVERFIHLAVPTRDVNRILLQANVRDGLEAFSPGTVTDMLRPWITRATKQTVAFPTTGAGGKAFDATARFIRSTASLNAMVGNVVNTLQQVTGFSIAALKVSPRYLAKGMVRYMRAPQLQGEFVHAQSAFMRSRNATQLFETRQAIDNIVSDQSTMDTVREAASKHGYFLQSTAQLWIDNIVWLGRYEEATVQGMTSEAAARAADTAVRLTQGSFAPEDISRAATGNAFARLFTMYFDYFNMQANLLGTEFGRMVYNDMGLKQNAARGLFVLVMGFTVPAFLGELISVAMRGELPKDDDDENDTALDEWLSLFFSSQARTAMAFAPGVGQVGALVINLGNDKVYDDRLSLSPVTTVLEGAARATYVPIKLFTEDEWKKRDIRDVLSGLSLLTRVPLTPLAKPLGYLWDVGEGAAQPTGPVDFTRGLMVGR